MKDFSKFFDSVISGNERVSISSLPPRKYNNDNIIYNINNINKELPKTFPIEDYYLISNEIILGASKQYYELYKDFTIPYSFFAFYFIEVNKYKELQSGYLKKFFVLFSNKNNNIANAVNIINKTYKNLSNIKFVKKSSIFSQLKAGYYLEVSKEFLSKVVGYKETIEIWLKSAIDETREIINQIKNSATSTGLKSAYLEYLSKNNEGLDTEVSIAQETSTQPEKKKRRLIAPPKQSKDEKVSSIVLPRLTLNKCYITSLTHSRIDSSCFASKFLEPAEAYNIIKKYKFKRVKYTLGFETKRKKLFEVKKSAFDLF